MNYIDDDHFVGVPVDLWTPMVTFKRLKLHAFFLLEVSKYLLACKGHILLIIVGLVDPM